MVWTADVLATLILGGAGGEKDRFLYRISLTQPLVQLAETLDLQIWTHLCPPTAQTLQSSSGMGVYHGSEASVAETHRASSGTVTWQELYLTHTPSWAVECAETARHEVWLLCLVLQVAAVQVQGPTNCNGSRFQPRKHRGNIHKLAIWPVVIKEDHVRIN